MVEAPNPAYSQHLVHTNAAAAHAAGYTGAGVRIGFVDSGVNRNHPAFGGRVVSNLVYIDGRNNNLTVDDVVGHGTAVAQAAAGQAFGKWPGGIAPGAEIVSARIISDSPPEDDGSGEGNEVDGPLGLAGVQRPDRRGVRIMNNSWGGLYWSNPNVTAAIAAEYRPFIIGNDGLVVFATGNSAFAAPSDMAALPSQQGPGGSLPAADLARGWIAVAALAEGSTSHLATYSNACGIAMDYCMVAPGTVVVTGVDNPPHAPDYWRWSGTSLAAPLVSGAAALVWQAFPYFNNDLVRQTLLGTATDLGASGIDPVFGNGALDVGKAVGGPARLDWGTVTADFDGFSSSWWNQLSGAGAVRKQGSGTLVLENNALNGGGLEVAEGTLHARGGVAGDVWVGPAGRFLTGTRLWGGLENAGRVEVRAPGGQGGSDRLTLEVQGDLIHRAGATLGIELGTGLRVIGAAVIEGGDLQVLGVRNGYTTSSREELLFATARVTGTFDALTAAPGVFLDASLAYTDFHVWLDIQRLDITAVAASFNAVTPASMLSAERIEQAFREIDRQQRDAGGAIDGGFITAAGEFQRIGTQAGATAGAVKPVGRDARRGHGDDADTIDMAGARCRRASMRSTAMRAVRAHGRARSAAGARAALPQRLRGRRLVDGARSRPRQRRDRRLRLRRDPRWAASKALAIAATTARPWARRMPAGCAATPIYRVRPRRGVSSATSSAGCLPAATPRASPAATAATTPRPASRPATASTSPASHSRPTSPPNTRACAATASTKAGPTASACARTRGRQAAARRSQACACKARGTACACTATASGRRRWPQAASTWRRASPACRPGHRWAGRRRRCRAARSAWVCSQGWAATRCWVSASTSASVRAAMSGWSRCATRRGSRPALRTARGRSACAGSRWCRRRSRTAWRRAGCGRSGTR